MLLYHSFMFYSEHLTKLHHYYTVWHH
jgi:hypothetical protein